MNKLPMGFILIMLGSLFVLAAVLILFLSINAEVKGFGFILIGPIPIILSGGADVAYILLAIFGILLIAVLLLFMRVMRNSGFGFHRA
ncbi:MAG: DUF131 domain-containing protein [Desulfurococcales archaeon]|jgi:uncharacterized membrane protein|nr:DUF131 domain-containing protein [Desulfurococcales archaeon]